MNHNNYETQEDENKQHHHVLLPKSLVELQQRLIDHERYHSAELRSLKKEILGELKVIKHDITQLKLADCDRKFGDNLSEYKRCVAHVRHE